MCFLVRASFHSQINMMFPELDLLDCNPGLPESKHTGEIQIYFYSLWQMLFETWLVRTEVQWMCFTFVLLTDRGQMTQCKDPQLSDKRKTCVPESSLPLTIALWLWACPPTSPEENEVCLEKKLLTFCLYLKRKVIYSRRRLTTGNWNGGKQNHRRGLLLQTVWVFKKGSSELDA